MTAWRRSISALSCALEGDVRICVEGEAEPFREQLHGDWFVAVFCEIVSRSDWNMLLRVSPADSAGLLWNKVLLEIGSGCGP